MQPTASKTTVLDQLPDPQRIRDEINSTARSKRILRQLLILTEQAQELRRRRESRTTGKKGASDG